MRAVTDRAAQQGESIENPDYRKGEHMADTGERREIKERTDAREEDVVAESKKLLQQAGAMSDQVSRRRRRINKKEESPASR